MMASDPSTGVSPRCTFVTPALPLSLRDFARLSIEQKNRNGTQNILSELSTVTDVEMAEGEHNLKGTLLSS